MECGVVDLMLTKYHHLHPQEKKKIQLLHNWAPDCLWGWRRVQNVKQNCKAMNHAECHHNFFRHGAPFFYIWKWKSLPTKKWDWIYDTLCFSTDMHYASMKCHNTVILFHKKILNKKYVREWQSDFFCNLGLKITSQCQRVILTPVFQM